MKARTYADRFAVDYAEERRNMDRVACQAEADMSADRFQISAHTDSDDGHPAQPTSAKTEKTAIREAKKLARQSYPNWDYESYGPHWTVFAADGQVVASGRL